MSNMGRQSGSNGEALEVSIRYKISLDDIAVHIRRTRESALPLFLATIGLFLWRIGVELCRRILELFLYLRTLK